MIRTLNLRYLQDKNSDYTTTKFNMNFEACIPRKVGGKVVGAFTYSIKIKVNRST